MTPQQNVIFKNAFNDVADTARQLFDVSLSKLSMRMNRRGHRSAGQANTAWNRLGGIVKQEVRFHTDAVEKHFHFMVTEAIPHEIAHLVYHEKYRASGGHGVEWARMCKALGGTGEEYLPEHMSGTFGTRPMKRKKYRYIYVTSSGKEVWLGPGQHKNCQAGDLYRSDKDRSLISKEGYVKKITV